MQAVPKTAPSKWNPSLVLIRYFPLILSRDFPRAWFYLPFSIVKGNRRHREKKSIFYIIPLPSTIISFAVGATINFYQNQWCNTLLCTVLPCFFSCDPDSICICVKCDALCQQQRMCMAESAGNVITAVWTWNTLNFFGKIKSERARLEAHWSNNILCMVIHSSSAAHRFERMNPLNWASPVPLQMANLFDGAFDARNFVIEFTLVVLISLSLSAFVLHFSLMFHVSYWLLGSSRNWSGWERARVILWLSFIFIYGCSIYMYNFPLA